ncbi:MAG: hypothetical protein ACSHWU_01650 [Marinicella sp.]
MEQNQRVDVKMNKCMVGVLFLITVSTLHASTQVQKSGGSLYDNGPIITSIGTGVGGLDESVLESSNLSMASFGTAHHSAANLRVADDFTITGMPWQINSIDFYAYQTNETASTITAINLRIWDGNPNDIGSTIIFGDDSTNVLNSTVPAGILRVNEDSQGMADDRQIAISNVVINMELAPGTYWLDWQTDGSGPSGPFVPHITLPGQDTTGNALLSIDNGVSYGNLQDLGTLTNQGLPFIINGSIVSGLPPQQVPGLRFFGLLVLALTMIGALFTYRRYKLH